MARNFLLMASRLMSVKVMIYDKNATFLAKTLKMSRDTARRDGCVSSRRDA
jgi:hypothetical protein